MLLRVGLIAMGAALSIAVGVALVVAFNGKVPVPENYKEQATEVAAEEPRRTVEEPVLKRQAPEPTREDPQPEPEPKPEPEPLPVVDSDWPEPSSAETADADRPRYFPPEQDSVLTLTVEALGLYDVPVLDSGSEAALDDGVIHIPQTPMPWEDREQKNVYLAGHRVGYPGTGSRLIFYNLDKLQGGDIISLKDRSGTVYKYRVTEMFQVNPSDDWVMDTVLDRDIVTLQTCAPIPTFEKRLIVRADRITANASRG